MTASKQDQGAKTTTREMGSKVPVIIGKETVVLPVHQLHRDAPELSNATQKRFAGGRGES